MRTTEPQRDGEDAGGGLWGKEGTWRGGARQAGEGEEPREALPSGTPASEAAVKTLQGQVARPPQTGGCESAMTPPAPSPAGALQGVAAPAAGPHTLQGLDPAMKSHLWMFSRGPGRAVSPTGDCPRFIRLSCALDREGLTPSVCDCVRTSRAGGRLHQGGLNTDPERGSATPCAEHASWRGCRVLR